MMFFCQKNIEFVISASQQERQVMTTTQIWALNLRTMQYDLILSCFSIIRITPESYVN